MPISDAKRFVFVHIPKNAGTAMEKHYSLREHGHKPWSHYRDFFPAEWEAYTSFAIVRDPVSRFVSGFQYAKMLRSYWHSAIPGEQAIYGQHPDYDLLASLDFTEFLNGFAAGDIAVRHQGWLPQVVWICDKAHRVMVDRVLRYERLAGDLADLGLEMPPKLNASGTCGFEVSEAQRAVIRKLYALDCDLFGY